MREKCNNFYVLQYLKEVIQPVDRSFICYKKIYLNVFLQGPA